MTLTLSIDDQLAQRARQAARDMGTDLNRLIVEYLEGLAAQPSPEQDIQELRRLSGQGDSGGWKFDREEIHERPKLP